MSEQTSSLKNPFNGAKPHSEFKLRTTCSEAGKELSHAITCFDENELMYISMANPEMQVVLADVTPNPDLFYELSLYRQDSGRLMWNRIHGKYLDESDEWEKISTAKFYMRPRTLGLSWAAYLLPKEVKVGDRVYVRDLVEDVRLMGNILAADGIAVWTGDGLEFEEEHWEELRKIKYWVVG